MKGIFTTVLFTILFTSPFFGQTPQQNVVDYVFYSTRLFQTVELDGKLYSVGEIENPADQNTPIVLSQDYDLNLIQFRQAFRWFSSGGDDFEDNLTGIVPSSDDALILVGESGLPGSTDKDPWIFKMDTNFNVLWQTFVETTDDEIAPTVISNNLGGALALVRAQPVSGLFYSQLINLDANGDTIWTKKIMSLTESIFTSLNVSHQLSNGDFLLHLSRGGSSEVLRIDQNGDYVQSFEYLDDLGNPITLNPGITYEDSVSFLVGNNSNYEKVLLKVDQNFDVIWCKKFGPYGAPYPYNILRDNQGNLIAKYEYNPFGTYRPGIIKLDALGNPLEAKIYGKEPNNHNLFSRLLEINDHIVISGSRSYLADKTIYQLCLDSNLSTNSCYEEDYQITTFPVDITVTKNITSTVTLASLAPEVISVGPFPELTYVNQSQANSYVLDDNLEVEIEMTGDDCGGVCNGMTSATATGGSPTYSFYWSNGDTGNTSDGLCSGEEIVVRASDQFGCNAYDTVVVSLLTPVNELCLITVDSTSTKNEVVWEKPISTSIEGFGVYREAAGNYTLVGYVPYDSLSKFIDNTNGVNPNITSYRYKITTLDTCGYESELSDYHETIHLTVNQGVGGVTNLIWDNYEGFSFSYNRIWKDSIGDDNWTLKDSVSSNVFTWTDPYSATAQTIYRIEVVSPSICTSTRAIDHNSTRSNQSTISGPPVELSVNDQINLSEFTVFPNPSSSFFTLKLNNEDRADLFIYDAQGRLVKSIGLVDRSNIIEIPELNMGVYILKVVVNGQASIEKLIKK